MAMTAQEFIRKWGPGGPAHDLGERAGAQSHFIDLCRLLGVEEPGDAQRYCFERGVSQTGAGSARINGFADVWLKSHFAWEYKAPGKNLDAALRQLMMYALPLESPPLLVVSDRLRIEIHTHFTGTPSERHVVLLENMARPEAQDTLRALWQAPERFKPRRSIREITEEAARAFAATADRLRASGVAAEAVSHFLTQCLFCFFAEDVGLLPDRLFEKLVGVRAAPAPLREQMVRLFTAMRDGGLFGFTDIAWFNGGLFREIAVPVLTGDDIAALKTASALNWSAIDPSIIGTLLERGLDPAKRAQLGAHYTDPATILRLVEPVVQRPLLAEWEIEKAGISPLLAKSKRHGDKAYREAQAVFHGFLEKLRDYRVLDPACGSGNFLYLALKCLKDIEHQINLDAEAMGLERQNDVTGPHNVLGIEINEFAAELARVTVWIGELQWRINRGYGFRLNPVLEPLDHIQHRDALIDPDGSETAWPLADAVVGNPPFIGDKKMRAELGDAYTEGLRRLFAGRVPGGADLVCYWFEKARAAIEAGDLKRAGLVATSGIRGGRNREVLDRISRSTRIFSAWSEEPWFSDSAAVEVSLVAFGDSPASAVLNGQAVEKIHADLSAGSVSKELPDLTLAGKINASGTSFIGTQKGGKFEITGQQARTWLRQPNLNGQSNADVLSPWINGLDIARRPLDFWIIDFGDRAEADSCLYELPWAHCISSVRADRIGNREKRAESAWWRLQRNRPELKSALQAIDSYIATARVAKYRLFTKISSAVQPDSQVVAFTRADDATFGILQSRCHELWSLRLGTSLEDRPRYTPTTCFETFPFPAGLTPADTAHQRVEILSAAPNSPTVPPRIPASLSDPVRSAAVAIARAAQALNASRDHWLNPPEWTNRVAEVIPLGMTKSPYPDRVVARPGFERELGKRTLTQLYNQRPTWLAQAHDALDAAVASAYGWTDYTAAMPDDELLRRLLALNGERTAA
jgi:hypothetical protein